MRLKGREVWLVLALGFFVIVGCGSEPSVVPRQAERDQSPGTESGRLGRALKLVPSEAGERVATNTSIEDQMTQRAVLDRTVWRDEVESLRYEAVFVRLWDELRNRRNSFAVLETFLFDTLVIPSRGEVEILNESFRRIRFDGPSRTLGSAEFSEILRDLASRGVRIEQSEWRQIRFEIDEHHRAISSVQVVIDALDPERGARVEIEGVLDIEWAASTPGEQLVPFPERIVARDFVMFERVGEPIFEEVMRLDSEMILAQNSLEPVLILRDLNDDGLSEIVLPGSNVVFRNNGRSGFSKEFLVAHPASNVTSAVMADLDGDGVDDLVMAGDYYAFLYRGREGGHFPDQPERIEATGPEIMVGSAIAAGDIDQDGDLDLWLAQYKPPYAFGQMPEPYYDANDGYPSFLLLNDGQGHFSDGTKGSGLEATRYRRTYSCSFVDFDGDRDLDLVRINDFYGVDVFVNDGGHFREVTEEIIDNPSAFGMSHTMADFDLDGRLDLFMIGMNSSAADRLEHLGIKRSGFEDHEAMRRHMTFGNRLYLQRKDGFEAPKYAQRVARTGWSWGSTSFDFDNDGDPDIYVPNGNFSGRTAADYDSVYWRHDIYQGTSADDPLLERTFNAAHRVFPEMSWYGFEHNALLVNLDGKDFVEASYLFGSAFEYDARGVVSDDLDNDGREDLVVVERSSEGPVLHIYRNLSQAGHWIGFHLRQGQQGISPIGAVVAIRAGGRTRVEAVMTGDSFCAQHRETVHFGLGSTTHVDWVEIRWPDGGTERVDDPSIDSYHRVAR